MIGDNNEDCDDIASGGRFAGEPEDENEHILNYEQGEP